MSPRKSRRKSPCFSSTSASTPARANSSPGHHAGRTAADDEHSRFACRVWTAPLGIRLSCWLRGCHERDSCVSADLQDLGHSDLGSVVIDLMFAIGAPEVHANQHDHEGENHGADEARDEHATLP